MRIAITGGTGFVGSHLANRLSGEGHEILLLARHDKPISNSSMIKCNVSDIRRLTAVFSSCEAVAHCAGINREVGDQTFQRVHVEGTRNVVEAAKLSGVKRLVLMSFLRARPNC